MVDEGEFGVVVESGFEMVVECGFEAVVEDDVLVVDKPVEEGGGDPPVIRPLIPRS